MPPRTPGVAEGKQVAAIPIGDGISISERVLALMGVTEETQGGYNVSKLFYTAQFHTYGVMILTSKSHYQFHLLLNTGSPSLHF